MTKRTSDQFMETNPYEAEVQAPGYHIEPVPVPVVMADDCDAVRRKIRALIDNGEMKVGEFQKAIDVLPATYSRFMSQNGKTKGEQSSVYLAAWLFFKQREMMGIKTTPNKKAKKDGGGGGPPPVDDVELEGERENKVPVYDTCDDIRRKINAHLKKPGVTQASFLRAVSASFHTTEKKLTARSLSTFRSKKGAYNGNTSDIFYGAYVYFEKLRIKENKPTSKKREEMEAVHAGRGGLVTDHAVNRMLLLPTDNWHYDAHARVVFNGQAFE